MQTSVWNCPPATLRLSSADVHVWRASLDQSVSRLEQLTQTLSPDEWHRVERFHFEKHRKRFIASRGILRMLLGRYLGIEPVAIKFVYSPRGKPALAAECNRELCFNLSHSEELAVYAFTYHRRIGIDVEHIRLMPNAEQIVERFFSEREKIVFRTLPPTQKQAAFFQAWTRKEAYLKATGDGLAGQLDQIEVSLVPGEAAQLKCIDGDLQAASCWSLEDLQPDLEYMAALAVEGHNYHLSCWQWKD